MMRSATVLAFVCAGCSTAATATAPTTLDPTGAVSRLVKSAAAEASVPADLLLAIAIEEGGIHLPALRVARDDDHVPVAGLLELRHGRLDTLALGATLAGTTEDALRADTDLATYAGARVLATLGAQYGATSELASWRPALEALSGMDDHNAREYASRVFAILRQGAEVSARDVEMVRVAPHPEIDVRETLRTIASGAPVVSDFPGAIWFTTSCTNKCTIGRPLGNASVDKIVIHDTEGGWNGSVATLQNDGGKSVHYIIDADGSRVGQFRPETDTTWHAGNYFYNETSIGIEHVGTAANPAGYASALYAKSLDLVKNIRTRWTIPLDRTHIVGHYQIPDGTKIAESSAPCTAQLDTCETSASYGGASNHRDPGYNWQWCQYMQSLGGSCTCNDAWPLWNCTTDHTEAVRCNNGSVEIDACPGGCDVQAVGIDDVCHTAGGSGSGSGSGSGTPDAGVPDADPSGNPADPSGAGKSGCAAGGHGGALGFGLVMAFVLVRRRQISRGLRRT